MSQKCPICRSAASLLLQQGKQKIYTCCDPMCKHEFSPGVIQPFPIRCSFCNNLIELIQMPTSGQVCSICWNPLVPQNKVQQKTVARREAIRQKRQNRNQRWA